MACPVILFGSDTKLRYKTYNVFPLNFLLKARGSDLFALIENHSGRASQNR